MIHATDLSVSFTETSESAQVAVHSPILDYLKELHAKYAAVRTGAVADYIPELAKANPDSFGICISTTDGQVYEVGDAQQPFTIQSISKPFTYGIALQDQGREAVLAKIGMEPTGDAFNSISLSPTTGAPLNPMINAGAIAACGLVAGETSDAKFARILDVFSNYAGRALTLDEVVFQSESMTGHRNRAIGHMLRNFDIIEDDPDPVLQVYFQQCSIAVTCRDLSIMAATLANGGQNPVTGKRVLEQTYVDNVLSIMATCGMYDYSGEWFYNIGLPAKSGVCGGIVAVLPGQLGIAVFSPALDARGNSVRGIGVCKELSRDLSLHVFNVARPSIAPVRSRFTAADVHSKRVRSPEEQRVLHDTGARAVVFDLQGDLSFPALELVARAVVAECEHDSADFVLLDLKRVSRVDLGVGWMLVDLFHQLAAHDKRLLFVDAGRHPEFMAYLQRELGAVLTWARLTHPNLDAALEWCEDRLLEASGYAIHVQAAVPLSDHLFCSGLDVEDVAYVAEIMDGRRYQAGDVLVRSGDQPDHLYFVGSGQLSVTIDLPEGGKKRLATLLPGMMFGELAIVDRNPRSADVHADTTAECFLLSLDDFDRLSTERPALKSALLENVLRTVTQTVYRLSNEVRALAE